MVVGWEKRYFAAHEDVLSQSPWFHAALQEDFLLDSRNAKQLYLPDESVLPRQLTHSLRSFLNARWIR